MGVPLSSELLLTVSPTKLEDLAACPLRVAFEQITVAGSAASLPAQAALGLALHRTIQLCLTDRELSVESAWALACDELARNGSDPREAVSARRTILRIQRRLPDLLAYVSEREPSEVLLEHTIRSRDGSVKGRIDLLVLGERPAIVDHKTGLASSEGLPRERYVRQLAIYAWLVQESLGIDIAEAALFSSREGIVEVDVSAPVREPIVAEAMRLRDAFNERVPGTQPATPSDEACGTCQYVGLCDPAWEALGDGVIEGASLYEAVRGHLCSPVVTTASGLAAVPIAASCGTVTGEVMLTDVPLAMTEGCSVGDRVAAWRLRRRSDAPVTLAWREGYSSLHIERQQLADE
jgi:CRISPR/Cas system-associated exonuclease Cas4 (RecB family)